MPLQRLFSQHTIDSYRQTMQLLRDYVRFGVMKNPDDIDFTWLSPDFVRQFLQWLVDDRGNAPSTINQRLAVIKSFLKYCGEQDISLTSHYLRICQLKSTKIPQKAQVEHLSEDQLHLLFRIPNLTTRLGRRDATLMILLYETGTRMQEMLNLKLADILWNKQINVQIRITGKGNKTRLIPLLGNTAIFLKRYIGEFHRSYNQDDYLFFTRHRDGNHQMVPNTVDSLLKKYAAKANEADPTFPLNLHAHMLRHSIAMIMYGKGIPLSYIRDFLGHSSVETTSIYAFATPDKIAEVLENANKSIAEELHGKSKKLWREDKKSLAILCGLR